MKRKLRSNDLIDLWRNEKLELIKEFTVILDLLIEDSKVTNEIPEWSLDQNMPENIYFKDWSEFINSRKIQLSAFNKTGELTFKGTPPYEFKFKDRGFLNALRRECDHLTEALILSKNIRISDFSNYALTIKKELISLVLGMMLFSFSEDQMKQYHLTRTQRTTATRREQRTIKERYVTSEYLKMINDPTVKDLLKGYSEFKLANKIKSQVEPDLKAAKTKTGKTVCKSISEETIIDILRKRDKKKIPSYPWENRR